MTQQQSKSDVFTIVNNRIIEQLEKKIIPWKQPWTNAGIPRNLVSGRPYRGINLLLLSCLGFTNNVFLSVKQINDLGGKIKKGEHMCPVVFWSKKEELTASGEKKEKRILRYYSVFNIEQCTGISENKIPKIEFNENDPIKACEDIYENMSGKPKLQHRKQEAYYSPIEDMINMPKMKTFTDSESYYQVLFHELIHSTGHASRLNREGVVDTNKYKIEKYSEEELIAQIGSCFLLNHVGLGVKHFDNDVNYILGWLEKLAYDKKFILFASSKAQRAVDYILNYKYTNDNSEEVIPEEVNEN